MMTRQEDSTLPLHVADIVEVVSENPFKNQNVTLPKSTVNEVGRQLVKRREGKETIRKDVIGTKCKVKGRKNRDVGSPKPIGKVSLAAPSAAMKSSNLNENSTYVQLGKVYRKERVEDIAGKENGNNRQTALMLESEPPPAHLTSSSTALLQPRKRPKRTIDLGPEPDYDALN
jgi:hypothetical protein